MTHQEGPVKSCEDLNEVKFPGGVNDQFRLLVGIPYKAFGATPDAGLPPSGANVYGACRPQPIIQGQENPTFFLYSDQDVTG